MYTDSVFGLSESQPTITLFTELIMLKIKPKDFEWLKLMILFDLDLENLKQSKISILI